MKFKSIADLERHLASEFAVESLEITLERPPPNLAGDIAVNCFRLASSLRCNPIKIASAAAAFLESHPETTLVEQVKAYVNVSLEPESLFSSTVGSSEMPREAGLLRPEERRRIAVEFSAPNTNKPQHLGHIRNNTLGQATVSLLRRVGHETYAINLVNDRGIHICKSMLAYARFGEGETPEKAGKKGDYLVGEYYVKFDREYRRQVVELRQNEPGLEEKKDEDLFLQTEIGRAAQDMLSKWEAGDPEVKKLWRTMNDWVLAGFEETYNRLGVVFDKTYLESETYGKGKEIIQECLDNGLFQRREDGAVFVDLDDLKLGRKILLRGDGTSVYVTQDLGTTVIKQRDFEPHRQIWIVGDEQIYHFKVLFAILRKIGYSWCQPEDALFHMAYGMVNLPSGKMKSREGTVVDADDLLDEMENLARKATLQRYPEEPDDLSRRARLIGLGALKFMLLKVNPGTTLMFDPEASLKFEGDTGPYLLYAYARIASMLRKAAEDGKLSSEPVNWDALGTEEEKDLALSCGSYPEVLPRAAKELDPSILTNYLLILAKSFSRFYRECSVLNAESLELRDARLELSRRVRDILADGLETLGIEPLESM